MEYNFSKSFLEVAYRAIMLNAMKDDDAEMRKLTILFEVCDKYKIPVKDFLDAMSELDERTQEEPSDE